MQYQLRDSRLQVTSRHTKWLTERQNQMAKHERYSDHTKKRGAGCFDDTARNPKLTCGKVSRSTLIRTPDALGLSTTLDTVHKRLRMSQCPG